jgi:hypothetical protein
MNTSVSTRRKEGSRDGGVPFLCEGVASVELGVVGTKERKKGVAPYSRKPV